MIIYYAHCMAIYYSAQETRDIELLESIFGARDYNHEGGSVLNPSNPTITAQCNELRQAWNENRLEVDVPGYPGGTYATASDAVMDRIFRPLVKDCNVLAFRALPDGTIPSGVAQEIQWAHDYGIPVIELPSAVKRRTLTLDQTRDYLKEIGQR